MTISIQDLRQWTGATVLDRVGDKVGTLDSVYVDPATDEPMFVAVRIGLPGFHKKVLVPLDGAAVGKDDLRVAHEKEVIKASPTLPVDAEVAAEDEPLIFGHYQLSYSSSATPAGRRLARH